MSVRAIRGAVQLERPGRDELLRVTTELLEATLELNTLSLDDLICIFFTGTPDLTEEFPALAARNLGMGDIPLMCSVEMDVAHALPRIVRIMILAEMNVPRAQVKHCYLGGAKALRLDIAQ